MISGEALTGLPILFLLQICYKFATSLLTRSTVANISVRPQNALGSFLRSTVKLYGKRYRMVVVRFWH